jgi:hypothetical protein
MAGFCSFLWLNHTPLHIYIYIYHVLFIHLSVRWYLRRFHSSSVVSSAAINASVQVPQSFDWFSKSLWVQWSGALHNSGKSWTSCNAHLCYWATLAIVGASLCLWLTKARSCSLNSSDLSCALTLTPDPSDKMGPHEQQRILKSKTRSLPPAYAYIWANTGKSFSWVIGSLDFPNTGYEGPPSSDFDRSATTSIMAYCFPL